MVHVLLKPGLENFEHYFTSVWDECNCVVVWAFFGIAFLWDWNENWPFLHIEICIQVKKLQRMRCLDGITDTMDMGLGGLRDLVMNREAWHAAVHGITKRWIWLSDWTDLNYEKWLIMSNSSRMELCKHRKKSFFILLLAWFQIHLQSILIYQKDKKQCVE